VYKIIGERDDCERNHVCNIFVINTVGKLFRSKLSALIFALEELHLENHYLNQVI